MSVSGFDQEINSSIYITIMYIAAFVTSPIPYSKVRDTFRPRVGQTAATRTDLGGKTLVDFVIPCAMLNSLVREHVTEGRPACITNGLRRAGFGESGEAKRVAFTLQVPALERHPTECLATAIAKVGALMLPPRLCVLLAYGIDRTGVDSELQAAARSQYIQVETGRPFTASFERVLLSIVAEVENVIDCARLPIKQAIQRFNPVTAGKNHAVTLPQERHFLSGLNAGVSVPRI